jgi:hypothetical protein
MMWLYVLSGRRAKALAQYEVCACLLAEELAIEPMAELRALYHHIRADAAAPETDAPPPAPTCPSAPPGRIDRVLGAIERERFEVYDALCDQFP